MSTFRVSLEKDNLVFSAAHFITFESPEGIVCEPIHGHNYGVKCEVEGPLNDHGYVVDFIALRDNLSEIIRELDHHVVLPTKHPLIRLSEADDEVTVTFEGKRWVFPAEDCLLLPIANTTAELMAHHIAHALRDRMREAYGNELTKVTVAVDENRGQWGVVELDW